MYETVPDLEIRKTSKHDQPVQVEPNNAQYGTCVPALQLEPNISYEVFRFQQQNSKLLFSFHYVNPNTCTFQELDAEEPT